MAKKVAIFLMKHSRKWKIGHKSLSVEYESDQEALGINMEMIVDMLILK